MKQEIVYAYPPLYKEIVEKFPDAREKGVIFSWGDKIYNPSGGHIPPQIIAHEAVHGERQFLFSPDGDTEFASQESVRLWWMRYLESPEFRLAEELPAHQEEYKVYCKLVKDRERRANYLHKLACRLAGPLYGRILPYMKARQLISGKLQT